MERLFAKLNIVVGVRRRKEGHVWEITGGQFEDRFGAEGN